jgi:hypothetical protein
MCVINHQNNLRAQLELSEGFAPVRIQVCVQRPEF